MYVDVPPDQLAVKVIVLPVFCVDGSVGVDVNVGVPRAVFTNTTSFEESRVTGVVALSVTPMQYEFVDVGVTVMLFDVADTDEYVASTFALSCEQVFPDGPVYHFTVYGDVPPDQLDDRVILWPESIVGFAGVGVAGVVSAGFTLISLFMEFVLVELVWIIISESMQNVVPKQFTI